MATTHEMSVTEAAAHVGLSRAAIINAIHRSLPARKVGRQWILRLDQLMAWFARSNERRELSRVSGGGKPVVREAAAGAPDHEVGDE